MKKVMEFDFENCVGTLIYILHIYIIYIQGVSKKCTHRVLLVNVIVQAAQHFINFSTDY